MAEGRLALGGVSASAGLDAELLLVHVLDRSRSALRGWPECAVLPRAAERFRLLVARRRAGEPLAYLTGVQEFWSLSLCVNAAVLVPRPESELLVERALDALAPEAALRVLDLGTGSGAIALALARERPLLRITATDLSEAALAVARHNANRLELPNVEFVCGSWAEPVAGRQFDVIVSNPPYVREADPALAALSQEPRLALAAGDSGLDAIEQIAAASGSLAAPDGVLLLEHGADQAAAVAALLRAAGWREVRCVLDHAGHPRVTIASQQAAVRRD